MTKSKNSISINKKRAARSHKFNGRAFVIILVTAIFVVAVGYMLMVVSRYTKTVTIEEPISQHQIRLELVDARTNRTDLPALKNKLHSLSDSVTEIILVTSSTFDVADVPNSFILSRKKDMTLADYLGGQLEISEKSRLYKELEFDNNNINLTLVVGDDFNIDSMAVFNPQEK